MKKVYLVQHSYEIDGCEENKIIGIFSSKNKAKKAVDLLKNKKGFRKYKKNFYISDYPLNKIYWIEGFFTYKY